MLKPNNMHQFSVKHLFILVASFCVAFAIITRSFEIGLPLLVAVSGFWMGFCILMLSDKLDNRLIDERSKLSQLLSVLGAMIIWFSLLVGGVYTIGIAVLYWLFSGV